MVYFNYEKQKVTTKALAMNYINSYSCGDLFDRSFSASFAYCDSLRGKDVLIDFAAAAFPLVERHETVIERAVVEATERKSAAGRPDLEPVFMMLVILLQRVLGLSDAAMAESLIFDLKVRYLLGIACCRRLVSRQAIWKYREIFAKSGLFDKLFSMLTKEISEKIADIGSEDRIIDSTFNVCPAQRNTKEENKAIKDGKGENLWKDQKHKKSHKDTDTRWTKKRGVSMWKQFHSSPFEEREIKF